jgi:deferrochelatase/peroxidase EfeB
MTFAVGAELFDERFGLGPRRPRQLVRMPDFPNDALETEWCHGDLLVQICAETPEETIHALRDLVRHTPDTLALHWKIDGFSATHGARARGVTGTGRNMLGFKDGTANADPTDTAHMNRLVWVQPGQGEPEWAANGSYLVVRLVRNFVERWDRTPLGEQEQIFGRHRDSGAPLGRTGEFDDPDYASDPAYDRIPADAHIRLANPVGGRKAAPLFRRGYNYSRGVTSAGQMDMGLIFVAFQSDLEKGFVAVQSRLNGEPLEEYIKPFGGGYYFALPGVSELGDYLGRALIQL